MIQILGFLSLSMIAGVIYLLFKFIGGWVVAVILFASLFVSSLGGRSERKYTNSSGYENPMYYGSFTAKMYTIPVSPHKVGVEADLPD